jgi:pimeloyl-ACP methyl ester carboxylesterase
MARASNGSVELEYESFGEALAPTVLLVNGLGSQLTRWPVPFCEKLVARGYRALRFDNRDVGRSSWLDGQTYALSDMAADAVAVLDAAGVRKAHVAGRSMGGMIVQRLAIDYPNRVLSMTSISSATGAPGSRQSTPAAAAVRTVAPPDPKVDFEGYVAQAVRNFHTISSPRYPWDDRAVRQRVIAEYQRAFNPAGIGRQNAAIAADGDRTAGLSRLSIPAVVLHGTADPLIKLRGGEMTAAAIPGAELRIVEGMGHDLPPALFDVFVDAIVAAAERAKAARTA